MAQAAHNGLLYFFFVYAASCSADIPFAATMSCLQSAHLIGDCFRQKLSDPQRLDNVTERL